MNAVLEQYGLTACVVGVAAMFGTYFAGMATYIPHIAIAAFSAVALAMVVGQYKDQFNATVEA